MPDYSYSDQAIIQGIEAIRRTHNNIDNALDQLEVYAKAQLDGGKWEGQAKSEYYTHKTAWDQSVNNMKDILVGGNGHTGAISALKNSLENYQNTERINSQAWQTG